MLIILFAWCLFDSVAKSWTRILSRNNKKLWPFRCVKNIFAKVWSDAFGINVHEILTNLNYLNFSWTDYTEYCCYAIYKARRLKQLVHHKKFELRGSCCNYYVSIGVLATIHIWLGIRLFDLFMIISWAKLKSNAEIVTSLDSLSNFL